LKFSKQRIVTHSYTNVKYKAIVNSTIEFKMIKSLLHELICLLIQCYMLTLNMWLLKRNSEFNLLLLMIGSMC
jgi:hypothetical protein